MIQIYSHKHGALGRSFGATSEATHAALDNNEEDDRRNASSQVNNPGHI